MSFGFGALPPEINSGRIYTGPGSAPLLAAAAAWDGLAAELSLAAGSYGTVVSDLTTVGWFGPSSEAAASAAAPYTEWLTSTAAAAEEAAFQAKAAAGAYEAVFAAVVPPPVIATNRAITAALIATNIFGQNTPSIAAAEAQYGEFWAQDAAALYAYAGSSVTATQLTQFSQPPQTTSAEAQPADSTNILNNISAFLTSFQTQLTNAFNNFQTQWTAASSTFIKGLPGIPPSTWQQPPISNFVTLTDVNSFLTGVNAVAQQIGTAGYSPIGLAALVKNWYQVSLSIPSLGTGIQGIGPLLQPKALLQGGALAPLLHSPLLTGPAHGAASVAGWTGRAAAVGALSVPQTWVSSVPAIQLLSAETPEVAMQAAAPALASTTRAGMFGQAALSSLAGRAFGDTATRGVTRTVGRAAGYNIPRFTDGVAADDIASTATIIVIPPSSE